ncbi:MAG: cyclic pyranopterin monophosphate synthase MoaC [Thermoplasmata archaeon]|nr:cyclic pyranopterin monophosphate synthase MoaC [Thermoplasmata archaeon]MCI4341288.1 cyclic pyranopterin monophosphate synthase MoaC [Thermoplasmata archaeon]
MTRQRRIHEKPIVYRRALVTGELRLSARSRRAMAEGTVEKGDPLLIGELAGLQALKRTDELIPHAHPVPITGSRVELRRTPTGVRVTVEVETLWRTGVEMEALVGASIALLTVWDTVKYLEKNAAGGYPYTRLGPVKVVRKEKRPMEAAR